MALTMMAVTDPSYFYQTHFLPDIIRFIHDTDWHSNTDWQRDRLQFLLPFFDNQHYPNYFGIDERAAMPSIPILFGLDERAAMPSLPIIFGLDERAVMPSLPILFGLDKRAAMPAIPIILISTIERRCQQLSFLVLTNEWRCQQFPSFWSPPTPIILISPNERRCQQLPLFCSRRTSGDATNSHYSDLADQQRRCQQFPLFWFRQSSGDANNSHNQV
jgi:hypothetical protein